MCSYHLSNLHLQPWAPNGDLSPASLGPRAVCPEAYEVRKSKTWLVALRAGQDPGGEAAGLGGPAVGCSLGSREPPAPTWEEGRAALGGLCAPGHESSPSEGLPTPQPGRVGVAELPAPREPR